MIQEHNKVDITQTGQTQTEIVIVIVIVQTVKLPLRQSGWQESSNIIPQSFDAVNELFFVRLCSRF